MLANTQIPSPAYPTNKVSLVDSAITIIVAIIYMYDKIDELYVSKWICFRDVSVRFLFMQPLHTNANIIRTIELIVMGKYKTGLDITSHTWLSSLAYVPSGQFS